jgi:glycosyltransferase involved in cell wall biosynthesis
VLGKVLMVASVASMIQQFNMRNIEILQQLGYEVEVACNFETGNTCSAKQIILLKQQLEEDGVVWHQIDFARNVFKVRENARAYRQLKKLFLENQYQFVHCHSPIGGVLGRLAAHKYKTRVIYTAHGFHFFKGAPKKNWLLFYPVEKFLSNYTDELIVINKEDYELAKKKFHMKKLTYIPGVGVNTAVKQSSKEEKEEKRKELSVPQEAFLIVQVAEFTPNKNQQTVIKALEKRNNADIYYVMCGIGSEKEALERYVTERHLDKNIRFLGFRKDVHEILQCADCFVLSSYREGLSVALMEAMAEGLPIVCGKIRGNVDLVEDGVGGILVDSGNQDQYVEAFEKLLEKKKNAPDEFQRMGEENKKTIEKFSCERVDEKMREVYQMYNWMERKK